MNKVGETLGLAASSFAVAQAICIVAFGVPKAHPVFRWSVGISAVLAGGTSICSIGEQISVTSSSAWLSSQRVLAALLSATVQAAYAFRAAKLCAHEAASWSAAWIILLPVATAATGIVSAFASSAFLPLYSSVVPLVMDTVLLTMILCGIVLLKHQPREHASVLQRTTALLLGSNVPSVVLRICLVTSAAMQDSSSLVLQPLIPPLALIWLGVWLLLREKMADEERSREARTPRDVTSEWLKA